MKSYRVLLFAVAVILSLACSLISNPIEDLTDQASQIVTEVGGTVQAVITEVPVEEIVKTAQAYATENPQNLEGIQATAEALQESFNGEAPADIPTVSGETSNFFANESVVSYFTAMEFSEVLDFYQTEMPANGWEENQSESILADETAILHFAKPDRTAIVTLSVNPMDGQTIVLVSLTNK